MGLIVYPSEDTLWFIDNVDTLLLYMCVLVQTPLALMILLFTLVLLGTCHERVLSYNETQFNRFVFSIAHRLYQFIKTDTTYEVPRFVMFGFVAPVCYTYHLLVFGIVMVVSCVHQVWETLFITSRGPCDDDWMDMNDTDCVMLDIKINPPINAGIAVLAVIILVYTLALKGLMKLTGGKLTSKEIFGAKRVFGLRFVRVMIAVEIQVAVVLTKLTFVFYFISVQLGGISTRNRLDRNGWFAFSLLLDILLFVMLTPWFLFQRLPNEGEEGEQGFSMLKSSKGDTSDEDTIFTKDK